LKNYSPDSIKGSEMLPTGRN